MPVPPFDASTPPAEPLRLRLRTLTDLIAVVPYLIGFHPSDSLVVVGFAGSSVVFAARLDLPGPDTADVATTAQYAVSLAERQVVDETALIGYGDPADVDPLIDRCASEMSYAGLELLDALRVTGDRYWSLLCDVPECCPVEGVPFDVASTAVAATATLAGRVALPNREALERLIEPVAGAERAVIARATAYAEAAVHQEFGSSDLSAARRRLVRRGERLLDAAVRRYPAGGRLEPDEVAMLSVLLLLRDVTDAAWRRAVTEPAFRTVPMWTDLTRRVQPDLSAPVATLLGYAAWRNGEGALARLATQRALAVAAEYEPALLLHEIVASGVPPHDAGFAPTQSVDADRRRG